MLPRQLKAAYYAAMSIPMAASGVVYRAALAPRSGLVRVHLGPGQGKYLQGWTNVDANFISAKIDVWADLRRALPFRSDTVDAFYSHHMIEHLPDSLLPFHLSELLRCLKPGGVVRIGGPNGDAAIQKFLQGDRSWFPDYPDKRESVGGRFVNFVFCRGEHLTLLTASYLDELLANAGFVDRQAVQPSTETTAPELFDSAVLAKEEQPDGDLPRTLLIEARKPGKTAQRA